MGQVTLYLDSQTEERMKAAAKAAGASQSQWVAGLIREKTALEWPPSIARLAGAWEEDSPDAEEIRRGERADAPREPL
jgi:hypothetical protein